MKNFKDSVAGVEDAKYRKIQNEEDKAEIVSETPKPDAAPNAAAPTEATASRSTTPPPPGAQA